MKQILLVTAGVLQVGFLLFHVLMARGIQALKAPEGLAALMQVFNIQSMLVFAFFAYVSLFRWRDLIETRLGRSTATLISAFYFLRVLNDFVLLRPNVFVIVSCTITALLYAIPLVSARRVSPHAPRPESQHV